MKAEAKKQAEEERLEKIRFEKELQEAKAREQAKNCPKEAVSKEAKRAEIERKVAEARAAQQAQQAEGKRKTKVKAVAKRLADPNNDGMVIEEIVEEEVDVAVEEARKAKAKQKKAKAGKKMGGFLL